MVIDYSAQAADQTACATSGLAMSLCAPDNPPPRDVADEPAAFEVVDLAGRERVGRLQWQHRHVDDVEPLAARSEGSQSSIFRQLARGETDLLGDTGSERVKLADGGIQLRLRGDDRTGDLAVRNERMEIPGTMVRDRDVWAIGPQRERALQQRHGVDGSDERPAAFRPRQGGGSDDTAEAVADQVEAHLVRGGPLQALQQAEASAFTELASPVFHFPEREGSQRRQNSAETNATAKADRLRLGGLKDTLGIERLAIGTRCSTFAFAAQRCLSVQNLIGFADLQRQPGGRDVLQGCLEDGLQRRPCRRRVRNACSIRFDQFLHRRDCGCVKRHRVTPQLFISPGQAGPMQADQQRAESRPHLMHMRNVGLIGGHGSEPPAILASRSRDVALPAVADQEHIGDRLAGEGFQDLPADGRSALVALVAQGVERDEIVGQRSTRDGFDRHGVPPLDPYLLAGSPSNPRRFWRPLRRARLSPRVRYCCRRRRRRCR